jgi:transposase
MRDRELYAQILGIESPWKVENVELRPAEKLVLVTVERDRNAVLRCPECEAKGSRYDANERRWRHLDTCQYQTILTAHVPRVRCREHGVRQIRVPWAEPGSHFTTMFERLVIDWLLQVEAIGAVAETLGLSWEQVDGIRSRAVRRGLQRRGRMRLPAVIGIDETSFQRRHEYVTVVSGANGRVLWVGDERDERALDQFWEQTSADEREQLAWISMDMSNAYIASTRKNVDDADTKIVFDRFHVVKHANEFVDKVRKTEDRVLRAAADERLKGTKWLWLMRTAKGPLAHRHDFHVLRRSDLRTARAWAYKQTAARLWGYVNRYAAERAWKKFCYSASHSTLEPVKAFARMIYAHWQGVINAATTSVSNASAEAINSGIQRIKRSACGFRSRQRFREAIYFHFGQLDLHP